MRGRHQPHPGDPQVCRAIEHGRAVQERRAEEAATAELMRRKQMAETRKTVVGDRVRRFPSPDRLLNEVAELRQDLHDLYDEAAALKRRDDDIANLRTPTQERFPALGGQ